MARKKLNFTVLVQHLFLSPKSQKINARMAVGIGKYEHITSVLRDTLHQLPVTARTQFKIAALNFDCVRGTGPVYLKQVIRPVSDLSRRSLCSADCGDLFVSRANTSIGQRSFSVAAPVVWNTLPPDLRSPLNSRRQFRSKLRPIISDKPITLHDSCENNSLKSVTL